MKNLFYFVILILLLVFIYVQAKIAYLKVSFSFRFIGASFTLQNLLELLGNGTTQTKVRLGATIINDNPFAFIITGLSVQLFYKQMLVAQTIQGSTQISKIAVPANNKVEVIDDVTVFVNPATVELLQGIFAASKPLVDYTVHGKIFGIPLTFSDNFVWE